MKWKKIGKIFDVNDVGADWAVTHAALPSPFEIKADLLRVMFTSRDSEQRSRISFFDIDSDFNVKFINKEPILELGNVGTFDDRGMTSSQVVSIDGDNYFYYNGYNIATPARYRVAIGVAKVDAGYSQFNKLSEGPIVDRSPFNPCGAATPFVLKLDGLYRMWYTSFRKWEYIDGYPEPFYCIAVADSSDGLNWSMDDRLCIPLQDDEGGIVRPTVLFRNGKYHMWYSIRKRANYKKKECSYRIGYSCSDDGVVWHRRDQESGITVSDVGWDSEMVAYPYVMEFNDSIIMFYNGNGFGQSGIGCAVLESW